MIINTQKLSMGDFIANQVEKFSDREFIYDQKVRISYGEFHDMVKKVANSLVKLGIKKGDNVGVCLPNWHETAVLLFACAKIGATVVPFNPLYKRHEIEYILKNSEPKILFVSEFFKINVGLELGKTLVEKIITVRFSEHGYLSFEQILENGNSPTEKIQVQIDANEDLFCILYTSGTTGMPKGVMTTHTSIVHCAFALANELRCTEEDVFVVSAPLFHIFGITCNLATVIAAGARMVLVEKFHPEKILQLIEKEKVTVHQGVPTMFLKELEHENFSKYDLSSLRTGMVGASPITPEQMKEIREKMGINLCQSFGITETGSVTFTKYDEDEEIICSTLGKPIDGVDIKIIDESGNILPNGEIGEIIVKSIGNMKGYYKMPEETSKVIDKNGYYHTGDLGKLDENGNLHFVGRKKDLIIRGGYNIYPQEIEELLKKYPKVSEVAVIGLPDKVLGEVVYAVIKLKPNMECTEEEIKDYVGKHLAKYKIPSGVMFINEFPVTASGKIQKVKLRESILKNAHMNSSNS